MNNDYQAALLSALQSRIDRRGEQLAFLEACRAGYKMLQRHDKRRECDEDLMELKLQQIIDKRAVATIRGQARENAYLNSIVDELGLVSYQ